MMLGLSPSWEGRILIDVKLTEDIILCFLSQQCRRMNSGSKIDSVPGNTNIGLGT